MIRYDDDDVLPPGNRTDAVGWRACKKCGEITESLTHRCPPPKPDRFDFAEACKRLKVGERVRSLITCNEYWLDIKGMLWSYVRSCTEKGRVRIIQPFGMGWGEICGEWEQAMP